MCVKASFAKDAGEGGKHSSVASTAPATTSKAGESEGAGDSKNASSDAPEDLKPSSSGSTGMGESRPTSSAALAAKNAAAKEDARDEKVAKDAGLTTPKGATPSGYVLSGLPDYDWTPANSSSRKPHVLLWVTDRKSVV